MGNGQLRRSVAENGTGLSYEGGEPRQPQCLRAAVIHCLVFFLTSAIIWSNCCPVGFQVFSLLICLALLAAKRGSPNPAMASSPLGKGFLTGKIDENTKFDSSDFRNIVPRFTP